MTVTLPLAGGAPLIEAAFVARPNQFLVEARIEDKLVEAHMADQGRLHELLVPGARLLLAYQPGSERRTIFQAVAVYVGDELVSLDTRLANRLVAAALDERALPQFAHYSTVKPEVLIAPHTAHRFDFRLSEDTLSCLLEVKSVTQRCGNLALFPDAPTERGRSHVETLTALARNGQRCALLFVVQRARGQVVVPNEQIDPAFARALRYALASGVEVYAYRCPLTREGISLGDLMPVSVASQSPRVRVAQA